MKNFQAKLNALKRETHALALAMTHPQTPWLARLMTAAIITYAVSPIDLIPDVIPVVGLLDDLLILPTAIYFTLRLIPAEVMVDCRARAEDAELQGNPWLGTLAVIGIWLLIVVAVFLAIR